MKRLIIANGDRLLLEPKDQLKQRLGYSPDDADAFALTFAQPVAKAGSHAGIRRAPDRRFVLEKYSPFAEDPSDFDPFEW